ncbi:hypothetical protein [Blattabacterium cuenoti]|uniref:Uncharacterized protein n=1 Tax=Blattabacterium cuenoti BPAA TaxID=1229512 RepID=M4ZT49_9FLAO|nr:hypothetical protein [Blattabacterium cuenoti]BAM99862.1 hypothetical protein BPAA_596 [Blattabacterium cuenoti BPAA]
MEISILLFMDDSSKFFVRLSDSKNRLEDIEMIEHSEKRKYSYAEICYFETYKFVLQKNLKFKNFLYSL